MDILNGREVRAAVGGEGHEHHVAFAAFRQLAAGDDTFVVAVQDDLEQHRRIVGQAPCFVVAVARFKQRKINVPVDDLVQGIFK